MADSEEASSSDVALLETIARCEAAVASWIAESDELNERKPLVSEATLRAMLGDATDMHSAIRDAAPVVMAVETHLMEMKRLGSDGSTGSIGRSTGSTGTDETSTSSENWGSREKSRHTLFNTRKNGENGATVVELCGPTRGHLVGVLLQHLLPKQLVHEIVLVDSRWRKRGERKKETTNTGYAEDDGFSTHHLDALSKRLTATRSADSCINSSHNLPPTLTLHKAAVKNASHLQSLRNALVKVTQIENRNGLLFVARRLSGTSVLRCVQLFQAHSSTPVGLITQKGDPPEKLPSLKSKLQFVIGVNHFCTARQLWPAKKRFHEVSGAGLGAAFACESWQTHLLTGLRDGTSNTCVDNGSGDLVRAWRPADASTRNRDETHFPKCALTIPEQMERTNTAVALCIEETHGWRVRFDANISTRDASYFPLLENLNGFPAVAGVVLVRCEPKRWQTGGYSVEHYIAADPDKHGLCYEAVGVDSHGALLTPRTGVGFVSIAAHERGDVENNFEKISLGGNDGKKDIRSGRYLTHAVITRLCVKQGARGVGVTEALLCVARGFCVNETPVTVKTASEKAYLSFLKLTSHLKFVGFKDPSAAGVSKSRGTKTVVVVDGATAPVNSRLREIENWARDRDDERNYDVSWGSSKRETSKSDDDKDGDDASSQQTRIKTVLKKVCGAMNRAAPDTVVQCADAMNEALSSDYKQCDNSRKERLPEHDEDLQKESLSEPEPNAVAAAAAVYFTKRVWREPRYAVVFARIVKLVTCAVFKKTLLVTAVTQSFVNVADERVNGASVFFAAICNENVFGDDDEGQRMIRATLLELIHNAKVETSGDEGGNCPTSNAVHNKALRSLCVFAETGAVVKFPDLNERVRLVLVNATARFTGTQSAFAAERALRVFETSCAVGDCEAGSKTNGNAFGDCVGSKPTRGFFSYGRGQSLSRLETHREAVIDFSRNAKVGAISKTANKLHIVNAGTAQAVERGMLQGWVFQYIGGGANARSVEASRLKSAEASRLKSADASEL